MYCMKEDTRVEGPWEFGEYKDRRENAKLKKEEVAKLIRENNVLDLIENGTISYLHMHNAKKYKAECAE